jgi:hypothetical protein
VAAVTVEEVRAEVTYEDRRPATSPPGAATWCDARVTAAGFYRRMRFTVVTEPCGETGIGPHVGTVTELSWN